MVDFEGAITANGESLPDAWIGGLTESYTVVGVGRRYASLDIELTPLGAYTVLGRPMGELAGLCVPLVDLFGRELVERLRETLDWHERFDLIERFLLARAAAGPSPTPAVERAVALLHPRLPRTGRHDADRLCRPLAAHRGRDWRRSPISPRQPRFAGIACSPMPTQNIFPALLYGDCDRALSWLKDAFGFEEKAVYRAEDGAIHHAELRLGDGLIMLGHDRRHGRSAGPPPLDLFSVSGSRRALRAREGGRSGDHARAHRPAVRLTRIRRPRPRGQRVVVRHLQPA